MKNHRFLIGNKNIDGNSRFSSELAICDDVAELVGAIFPSVGGVVEVRAVNDGCAEAGGGNRLDAEWGWDTIIGVVGEHGDGDRSGG